MAQDREKESKPVKGKSKERPAEREKKGRKIQQEHHAHVKNIRIR